MGEKQTYKQNISGIAISENSSTIVILIMRIMYFKMTSNSLVCTLAKKLLHFKITHPSKKTSRMFKIAVDDFRVMEAANFPYLTIRTRREDDNLDKC